MKGYLAKLSLVLIRIQDRKLVRLNFKMQADFYAGGASLLIKMECHVEKCQNLINLPESCTCSSAHSFSAELHGDS